MNKTGADLLLKIKPRFLSSEFHSETNHNKTSIKALLLKKHKSSHSSSHIVLTQNI